MMVPDRTWSIASVEDVTGFTKEQIMLTMQTVARGAPLEEVAAFLYQAKALGLDPLARQCYWIRRRTKDGFVGTFQTGIDGHRAAAEASGQYAGSDPPYFRGGVELAGGKRAPEECHVTVWKIVQGHKSAFTGMVRWAEFYPGDGPEGQMWRKMPFNQLAKCAEAQALRKGFSQLANVRLTDEPEDETSGSGPIRVSEVAPQPPAQADHEANARRYEQIYGGQDEPIGRKAADRVEPEPQPQTAQTEPVIHESTAFDEPADADAIVDQVEAWIKYVQKRAKAHELASQPSSRQQRDDARGVLLGAFEGDTEPAQRVLKALCGVDKIVDLSAGQCLTLVALAEENGPDAWHISLGAVAQRKSAVA